MEVEVEAAAATCSPRLDCLLAFSSLSSALPAIATDLIGVKVRRTTQTYDTVVVGTVLTARGFAPVAGAAAVEGVSCRGLRARGVAVASSCCPPPHTPKPVSRLLLLPTPTHAETCQSPSPHCSSHLSLSLSQPARVVAAM